MEQDRKTYPLENKKIVVTRPMDSVGEFVSLLYEEKAIPIIFPTIETVRCELSDEHIEMIKNLERYDILIFTSVKGVLYFFELIKTMKLNYPKDRKTYAIGPATGRKLKGYGVDSVIIPEEFVAESLLEILKDVENKSILIPRAKRAREVLPVELERRGAIVHVVPIYDTVTKKYEELPSFDDVDVFTFTSPSTFLAFLEILSDRARDVLSGKIIASIGPVTSRAIVKSGYRVDIEAKEHTVKGLVEAMKAYFSLC